MGNLQGKCALVTGGGQGIGYAITEELLKAGCQVYIHYHSAKDGAQELVDLAQSKSLPAGSLQADLTVEA